MKYFLIILFVISSNLFAEEFYRTQHQLFQEHMKPLCLMKKNIHHFSLIQDNYENMGS